jgi:hypothetical protein
MRAREGRVCRRPLVFNLGFADEHYGDVIAYGIHAMALAALQPFPSWTTATAALQRGQTRIFSNSGLTAMREW